MRAATGSATASTLSDQLILTGDTFFQIDNENVSASDIVGFDEQPDRTGLLEACAPVVVGPTNDPLLDLTYHGEFLDDDGAEPEAALDFDELVGTYYDGEEFWYKLTLENTGSATATGVDFAAALNDANIEFDGSMTVFFDADGNGTFESTDTASTSAGSLSYFIGDVVPGEKIRFVIPAEVQQVGDGTTDISGAVDYTNDTVQEARCRSRTAQRFREDRARKFDDARLRALGPYVAVVPIRKSVHRGSPGSAGGTSVCSAVVRVDVCLSRGLKLRQNKSCREWYRPPRADRASCA